MPHSEAVLLQQLFDYANQTSKSMNSGVIDDTLGCLNAVKVAFQSNMKKYDRFLKVLRDFSAKRIYISRVKAKLKTLFKGHNYLILVFNSFLPKKHQITVSLEDSQTLQDSHASGFLEAVKLAIQYKRENNFHDFLKVLKDYKDHTIDTSGVYARMKELLKNHPDLIFEFNTFMPSQYRIKTTGNKLKDNGHVGQLPWDVLDIICTTLDFEDLFSFSGVCKNWRTFHKSNFLSEPLLVRYIGGSYSFISIPNQKIYDLNMMSCFKNCVYVRASSGYFILADQNNSFRLFNPFTRKNIVINATFTDKAPELCQNEALLAFEKCSEEYVLVVLCKKSSRLYVYQSRYYSWYTYSTLKPEEVVVDFVVLNHIIYVVTDKASIGVLNLNSRNIKFLNLKNTPTPSKCPQKDYFEISFRLVNCDDQLLLLDLRYWYTRREVYKIDLSTMNYVKMKTLGDIALFYVTRGKCWALSNPKRCGYKSNYVYEVSCRRCVMYDWNDDCDYGSKKINPHRGSVGDFNFFEWCFGYEGSFIEFSFFDWCFRHLKYQVDYSLVE